MLQVILMSGLLDKTSLNQIMRVNNQQIDSSGKIMSCICRRNCSIQLQFSKVQQENTAHASAHCFRLMMMTAWSHRGRSSYCGCFKYIFLVVKFNFRNIANTDVTGACYGLFLLGGVSTFVQPAPLTLSYVCLSLFLRAVKRPTRLIVILTTSTVLTTHSCSTYTCFV